MHSGSIVCVLYKEKPPKISANVYRFVTSPAGAVAKYCNEYVCLWVCVSVCLSDREDISGTARATFTDFCACCLCPWLGTSAGMLTIGRIAYRREGVTGVHSADEV